MKVLVETSAHHVHVSDEALEALFGMLYLSNNKDRLEIITKEILG